MAISNHRYPCPACGFLTMGEPPGSFEICAVCNWEDDHVQLAHPRQRGGANAESLLEAQAAARQRLPIEVQLAGGFRRDHAWRPLRADEVPDDPQSSRVICLPAADSGTEDENP